MNRRGFTSIVTLLIAAGILVIGGIVYYEMQKTPSTTPTVPVVTPISSNKPPSTPAAPKPTSKVHVDSISPQHGSVGTAVKLTGHGFTSDNVIFFGGGAISGIVSTSGVTLSFTVPQSIGPYCAPGKACPMYMLLITPQKYSMHVQNANGSSNTVSFTVTGANPILPN